MIPKNLTDTQEYAVSTLARGLYILGQKKPTSEPLTMPEARAKALEKLFRTPWDEKKEALWREREDKALMREAGIVVRSGPVTMKATGVS